MKFVLCQISNNLINPDNGDNETIDSKYYNSLYETKKSRGYVKPEHFWELPLWIGELNYSIKGHGETYLHIVTDIMEPLPRYEGETVYCFSVLDVNKSLIEKIVDSNGVQFALGGYVKEPIKRSNVAWFDSIGAMVSNYDIPYHFGTNWGLFKGMECIPRLTLSYGCTHRCKFCTVPNRIKEVKQSDIIQQAKALKPLSFKLVYINDKTYGQASNWESLKDVYEEIRAFNPSFEGFIVQTSVVTALKANLVKWGECGVKIVELGIETVNNDILKRYRKPQTEDLIKKAVNRLNSYKFDVIANLILGLIEETKESYNNTYNFIKSVELFSLNIYTLSIYNDTDLSGEVEIKSENDSNELSTEKSFWTNENKKNYDSFYNKIFKLGLDIL